MSTTSLSSAAGARNARYYTTAFNEFENANGAWRPSWNWAALVCSTGWFLYRRMFLFGAINLALLLLVALPFAAHLTPDESVLAQGAVWLYLLVALIVVPLLANWLYYRHLKRRLDGGGTTAPDMLSFGMGTAAAAVAALATVAAVVIGTGTDYEVRVQVVDALLSAGPQKAAVEAFIKQKEVPPSTQAEAAGLMPPGRARSTMGVKLIEIVPGGIVRIAFTGFRHINGRWVELVPDASDKGVEWRCYNVDMPERELPASCRAKRSAERKAAVFKKAPPAKAPEPGAGPMPPPAAAAETPAAPAK